MTAEYKSMIPHLTVLSKYAAKHAVAFCGVESNAIVEAMEEYAEQRIRENYVEKEFVEWYIKGDHNFATVFNSNPPQFTNFTEGSKHKYSLDELYDYWKREVKSKQDGE